MNKRQLRLAYVLVDILSALIVWTLFMAFRRFVRNETAFDEFRIFIPNYNFYSSLVLFPLCCLFVNILSGVYLHPQKQRQAKLMATTLVASLIISTAIFFVLLLDDVVVSYQYYYQALLVLFFLLFVVTYGFRAIVCHKVWKNYRSGRWALRTAIVGTGESARKIAAEIERRMPEYRVVGHIAENERVRQGGSLGTLSQLEAVIRNYNIQDVIIALDHSSEKQLFGIINSLYQYNVSIRFTPGSYEILIGSVKMTELGVSPMVSITSSTMTDWEACVKRAFDLTASILALIVLSPLFLIFALWIKCDSRGPVFYLQERIGQFGRPFKIVKFRTMYTDAEKGTPQLSSASDSRVTRAGHILRKYRLDELPQFWNIVKGEMSIVGPRPEREFYIKKIMEVAPYYCLVYKVRPGLTSWGPIRIGYSDTVEKMVERLNYDIIYMDNMSLKTDLKILLYTMEVVIKGKGV